MKIEPETEAERGEFLENVENSLTDAAYRLAHGPEIEVDDIDLKSENPISPTKFGPARHGT